MNENKIKTYCFGSFFAFVLAFIVLCCLPLSVFASGLDDGSGGASGTSSAVSLTQFPLPYGGSSGIGYGDYPLTDSIASGALDFARTLYPYDFRLVCINEVASDNSYITLRVYVTDGDFFLSGGTYPDISHSIIRNLGSYGSIVVKWDGSSYSELAGYSYTQYYDIPVDNWLTPIDGVPTLNTTSVLYNYPVYYSGGTISGRHGDLFVQYIPPAEDFDGFGFGEMSGSITPASGVDGQGFNIDFDFFVDMNPLQILGQQIKDGIDSLTEKVEDGFDTVLDSLTGAWGWLKSNTDTIVSKIVELSEDAKKPTSQQLKDTLDNSTVVGGVVDIAQEGKSFLDSLTASGINVPTAQDMDFDYPFTWKEYVPALHAFHSHTTTVHISFSWYESIRDKVLLVIGVFMTIGFTVYLIKQIPNLIAGVSGGASAGQSISDHISNNKGGKK